MMSYIQDGKRGGGVDIRVEGHILAEARAVEKFRAEWSWRSERQCLPLMLSWKLLEAKLIMRWLEI